MKICLLMIVYSQTLIALFPYNLQYSHITMSEIVSLFIGQPGIQIGRQLWPLLCQEHSIQSQNTNFGNHQLNNEIINVDQHKHVMFSQNSRGDYYPRAAFMDFDDMPINQLKRSHNKKLYNHNHMLFHKESCSANYARAYHLAKDGFREQCNNTIRKIIENCDNFESIMIYHSPSGGTGSGFFSSLAEDYLAVELPKKSKVSMTLLQSHGFGNNMVQTYNTVHTGHALLQYIDLAVMFDNQSLYNICENQVGITEPHYKEVNKIISQVASSLTLPMRSNTSVMGCSFKELLVNMVPYPRIHFVYPSYSELMSLDRYHRPTTYEITMALFKEESNLLYVNSYISSKISLALMFRGDINQRDIYRVLDQLKHRNDMKFVQWVPNTFKLSINSKQSLNSFALPNSKFHSEKVNTSCLGLANSMEFGAIFARINHKFDILYAKRAFVHWFVGYISQECFSQARQDLAALEKDYEEWGGVESYEQQQQANIPQQQ